MHLVKDLIANDFTGSGSVSHQVYRVDRDRLTPIIMGESCFILISE